MSYTPQKLESAIGWFWHRRKGGPAPVTYSMAYRYGPHSWDCSSALDRAFTENGLWAEDGPDNTDSLHADFEKMGWKRVQPNAQGSYDARRGDVFIWGRRGASGGSFGHTGIFVDADNIIHCNYGYNGITVNNHDQIWIANGKPPFYLYRPPAAPSGAAPSNPAPQTPGSFNAAEKDGPYWRVEAGDTLSKIATYYYGNASAATMDKIARFNGIANINVLNIGQRVYIPFSKKVIVQRGDTLSAIAARHGANMQAVAKLSAIANPNIIEVGEAVFIP